MTGSVLRRIYARKRGSQKAKSAFLGFVIIQNTVDVKHDARVKQAAAVVRSYEQGCIAPTIHAKTAVEGLADWGACSEMYSCRPNLVC